MIVGIQDQTLARKGSRPRGRWLFRSCLVLLLLQMFACSRFPGDVLELTPPETGATCNVLTQLKDNKNYVVTDIRTGNTEQPFVNLFEKGEEWGCLVSLWDGRSIEREASKSYVTMVKLTKDGSMVSLEPVEGKTTPVLRIPSSGDLTGFHFALYIVKSSIVVSTEGLDVAKIQSTSDTARDSLSAEERKVRIGLDTLKESCRVADSPQYSCFEKNRDDCRFYMKLYAKAPNLPDVDAKLKKDAGGNSCVLCAPEVCNGKDDDCDGQVDNMRDPTSGAPKLDAQGNPIPLTLECYEGKKEDLVNIERSKGICKAGTQVCRNGAWTSCEGQRLPEKEKCNGFDDDCDGRNDDLDEGALCPQGQACENGQCTTTICRPGQTECLVGNNKLCFDLQTDRLHCGACNNACGSGEVCAGGKCAITCLPGQTKCGNTCVDTNIDRANCGACSKACGSGEVCAGGTCGIECLPGQTKCNNKCVDTNIDRANCGACDKACGTGEVCAGGTCGVECLPGQTKCGNSCVDTNTDRANCGACSKACGSGEVCAGGTCGIECLPGQTKCNNKCVDTKEDRLNCSACGKACSSGEVCVNSVCQVSCPQGQTKCNNKCVDTQTDRLHCSGCGKVCNTGEICENSVCVLQCSPPLVKCNNKCVDTQNDRANCNACGKACSTGEVCVGGVCQVTCPQGQTKCNNKCVDTQTDSLNCGTCNRNCGSGESCKAGVCVLVCPQGQQVCGSNCCAVGQICCLGNVCANPNSSQDFCGCSTTNKGENCTSQRKFCQSGSCKLLCPAGQQACGSVCCGTGQTCCQGNVCTDPNSDSKMCGCTTSSSGTDCTANGETCSSGSCSTNCPGVKCGNNCCATGEICCQGNVCANPNTSAKYCGCSANSTGTDCSAAGKTCSSGSCAGCPVGQTQCGQTCVDTQADKNNCGTCGNACPSGQACVAGQCQVSCAQGETLCGGVCCGAGKVCCQGNVCVDANNDRARCGCTANSAGTDCSQTGKYCNAGTCQQCPTGYLFCTFWCINVQEDPSNCGKCPNYCPSGQVCVNGACTTANTTCNSGETKCGTSCCKAGQTCCRGNRCTNPQTDDLFCGCTATAYGSFCSRAGANFTCKGGVCKP